MSRNTRIFLVILALLTVMGGVMVAVFIAVMPGHSEEEEVVEGSGGKVALVELEGVITDSRETIRQIKKFRENSSVKGIILRVESPGGGVAASQEIYEEVRKTRESGKPIVVSMGSVAASGGFYVACGATKVMANRGTVTGSIGVISQFFRFDPLLGKIGVEVNTIKSGKMKDAGNPFRQMSENDRAYFQSLMDEVHRQFMDVVSRELEMAPESVKDLADGRVFTGEQAVQLGLVDTLGTFEDAIDYTASLAGIRGKPSVIKERERRATIFDILTGATSLDAILGAREQMFEQPILQYRMAPGL